MNIEQKTDLTYMLVDEMKNKVDEILLGVASNSSSANDSAISEKVDSMGTKVDSVDTKIDEIGTNTSAVKTKVDAINENVNIASTQIDLIDDNINSLTTKTNIVYSNTNAIITKINSANEKIDEIDTKTDVIGTKVNEISSTVASSGEKVDSAKSEIMGADSVNLTQINNKLTSLAEYFGDNPLPQEFTQDPFKLDEEFTGYTKKAQIFTTSDSVECTKEYTINELGSNGNYYILQVGVYCEDESFSVKFTCDLETVSEKTQIEYYFVDKVIDSKYVNLFENLTLGRNIFSKTFENISVLEKGNYVFIRLPYGSGTIVHSYKLEVFGSNISILTKPKKYKVFSKFDDIVISKIENYNGYYLTCLNSELNPNTLNKNYILDQENVRDYYKSYCSLNYSSVFSKGVLEKCYVELDGHLFEQFSNAEPYKTYTGRGEIIDCIDYNGGSCLAINCCMVSHSTSAIVRNLCYLGNSNAPLVLSGTDSMIANFTFVKHIHKVNTSIDNRTFSLIITKRNGDNILYDRYNPTGLKIELGYGENVTAFFEKDDDTKIHVYMKVGDKMVKKTVQKVTTTNEDETTTTTFEIIEQKVIGTYDIYYETNTDKYFVVKNDELYVFKN